MDGQLIPTTPFPMPLQIGHSLWCRCPDPRVCQETTPTAFSVSELA